jgi:hypothetical protein
MTRILPTAELQRLALDLERFEAAASLAKTGTGARREGEQFEALVLEWWKVLAGYLASAGAQRSTLRPDGRRAYDRLTVRNRSLYLPTPAARPATGTVEVPKTWFEVEFPVRDLIRNFPGEPGVIERYSPRKGSYARDRYPEMYAGMKTSFDGTIVCEEGGVLREKILLEYKTGKSSKKVQIDGNAHERLSFQIMQYLEVATRFPRCSLVVVANGAFAFYRNKYHVNFHVQAERLKNFAWFNMEYLCGESEYAAFAFRLIDYLLGKQRTSET